MLLCFNFIYRVRHLTFFFQLVLISRKLRSDFGRRETPSAPYVRYLAKKVQETDILVDKPKREKSKTVRTPESIAAVAESVCEASSTSIHRSSQQLNISETSLRQILHKDLGMTPYKVHLIQKLKPIDHPMLFYITKIEEEDIGNNRTALRATQQTQFARQCRKADVVWSPRSCDLAPLPYCL